MAYNNIDQAYTIPVNRDLQHLAQQLTAQGERRRMEQDRYQKELAGRADDLTKMVGDEFRDKNFMTGTAQDPLINQRLADTRRKYADMIRKNPSMSLADLQSQLQKDMGDIGGMSSGIKGIRANIETQAKVLEKYPGIDANALRQLALNNSLYKVDPKTGQKTLREPSEIDPTKDYVQDVLINHPELVARGDLGVRNYLKGFETQDLSDTQIKEYKGVTREHKFQAKVPAYMELDKDEKGIVKGVKVRSEEIPGIKNPDGTPLKVVDKDVYQTFNTDPASSIFLMSKFKEYNSQQKEKLDPTSPEADLVKRKLLYDYLQKNAVYEYKPEDKVTNAMFVDKQQAGVPLNYRQGMSDAAKLLKENQKLDALDPSLIMRGLGGDQTVLEGAKKTVVDGKTYFDISDAIGGMKVGVDAEHKPVYAKSLMVDPTTQKMVVEYTTGEKREFEGKGIRTFIKRVSEYNGITLDKADASINRYMDKDGRYIGKRDTTASVTAQAEADVENFRKKKQMVASVEDFSNTGDLAKLKPAQGRKLANGDTIVDFVERSRLKQIMKDPYYVSVKGADGKTSTIDFKTREEMAQWIKENVR